MTVETCVGIPVDGKLLRNYFCTLVNQVYKILPMREEGTKTLRKYIWRLSAEIAGGASLYPGLKEDAYYASLLNILQYLSDHTDDCTVEQTRQLVFEGIHLCEMLEKKYADSHKVKEGGAYDKRLEGL